VTDAFRARFRELAGSLPGVCGVWSYARGSPVRTLVPADGCVDLIVRIPRDGRVESFLYEPTTLATEVPVDGDDELWGVRLRAGHGGPLLAHADSACALAVERVQHGADVRGLEAAVVEAVGGSPPALIRDFVARAVETHGNVRLASSDERALQRAARAWLGMTCKGFLRIQRAHAARDAIARGSPLADVAADLGYADQAHLSRDARAILGLTPRALSPVGGETRSVGFLQDPAPALP